MTSLNSSWGVIAVCLAKTWQAYGRCLNLGDTQRMATFAIYPMGDLDPFPKIFSETEGRNILDACRMRGTGFRSSGPQSLTSSLLLGHGCSFVCAALRQSEVRSLKERGRSGFVPSSRLELRLRKLGRFRQIFLAMGLNVISFDKLSPCRRYLRRRTDAAAFNELRCDEFLVSVFLADG